MPGDALSHFSVDPDSNTFEPNDYDSYTEFSGGGSVNSAGGSYIEFENPNGGSFAGNNWGGVTFLLGYIDTDSNTLVSTVFSPYAYQPPPGANDTAIFPTLLTGFVNGGLDSENDTLPGESADSTKDPNTSYGDTPYTYPGIFTTTTDFSYQVDLGGNTVNETFAVSGTTDSETTQTNGGSYTLAAASPNFYLSGDYVSKQDAFIGGNEGVPIEFDGGSGGKFETPFLDLYGDINVYGGTLSGDFTVIDTDIDPSIQLVDEGPDPVTESTVTISGAQAAINSDDTLIVGRSSNGPSQLIVEDGASAALGNVYLGGGDADSSGTLTIDDAKVTIDGFIEVGAGGSGTLTVKNGGTLSTGEDSDSGTGAYINGADEDDPSSVTVDGKDSTWTNSGDVSLGFYSNAPSTLTISNAGAVTITGNLVIGNGEDGEASVEISGGGTLTTGTDDDAATVSGVVGQDGSDSTASVTITGSDSKWTNKTSLNIGDGSKGIVRVEEGGQLEVDGSDLTIGSDGGTGSLELSGSGSAGNGGSGQGLGIHTLMTQAGLNFLVGYGGYGTLTADEGAPVDVNASSFEVGSDEGDGFVVVSGGSELTLYLLMNGVDKQAAAAAIIGLSGTGSLMDSGSSQVTINGSLTVGQDKGSEGTVTVTDTGTTLDVNEDPIIGMDGTGTFTIQAGAGVDITSGDLILGQDATGLGSLDIVGTGTTLQVAGDLIVGGGSTTASTMNVTDGGSVQVTGNAVVARDANSMGTVDLTGSGSIWTENGTLTIGQGGDGDVTVEDSATLQLKGDLTLAKETNSTGNLTIDGFSTSLNYTGGDVTIGSAGTGVLTAQNGGLVDLGGTSVTLGDESTGDGTLKITDTDSTVNTGDLTVGGSGAGTVYVQDGGTLTSSSATIADEENSTGTATVTGDDSTWTVGDLTVGGGGTGELDIEDGGTVTASGSKLTLGDESSGTGTITISGADSSLRFTGEIDNGENGKGVLAVQAGASFTALSMNIGDKAKSNGTFNVDGSGTKAEVQQDFNVGEQGNGALNVTTGAHLLNDADATIADLSNSSGTAVIDTSSVWTIGGDLSVGNQGIGGLQVSAGSFVSAHDITLGETADGGAGTAIVTGSDTHGPSILQFDNTLKVGGGGSGELDIMSGGLVKDSGAGMGDDAGSVDIAAQGGSTGKVTVSGTGSALQANSINVGGTSTSGGTGTLSVINGGSVTASGNVQVLAHGTVAVEANSNLTAAGIDVGAGGLLGGSGTIHGNVTNAGVVAPGDPQTTTIDGNYTEMSGGSLVLTLDGANSSDYDHLVVTGELSLEPGATLTVNFENGFDPRIGQTFDFLQYGMLDPLAGVFSSVIVNGLAPGFTYTVTPDPTSPESYALIALSNGTSTTAPEPPPLFYLVLGTALLALGNGLGFFKMHRLTIVVRAVDEEGRADSRVISIAAVQ